MTYQKLTNVDPVTIDLIVMPDGGRWDALTEEFEWLPGTASNRRPSD